MTLTPTFNLSKLRGRIVEKYGVQSAFAEKMGMSDSTMSLKMTSKSYFTAEEIYKACELLDIRLEEVQEYFFVPK